MSVDLEPKCFINDAMLNQCEAVVGTDQVLVAAVDGEVSQRDGHRPHHLIRVRAQQLHQDGKTFLLTHRGSDVVGPLEGRKRAGCDYFS